MNEENLLENKELREKYVSRIEVLEKVKELLLIPSFDFMTIQQVADYYEVDIEAVKKVFQRNKEELIEDGLIYKSGKEVKDILVGDKMSLTNSRGYFECNGVRFAYKNNTLFPRRAILRVGMLLRDSEVAKEVRTQLLNIEEKVSKEIKIIDINEEEQFMLAIGKAVSKGDASAVAVASADLVAFKNRHINKLQNDNNLLAGEILKWSDRSKLNAGVRKLASVTGIPFATMWNELYKNLQYKYGILLNQRGDKPYIKWIKENEWEKVIKTFCAMCEAYHQSPTDMFQQKTPEIIR